LSGRFSRGFESVEGLVFNGRKMQVSILTDDPNRKAEQIIFLMFSRWLPFERWVQGGLQEMANR
jgi:hypothetical protein